MNTNVQHQTSINKLFAGMTTQGTYDPRVILSKNNNNILGQKFLIVTRNAFAIVRLISVYRNNKKIIIELEDVKTGKVKKVILDVEDRNFKFLLIPWQDVLQMFEDTIMNMLIVGV